MNLKRIYHLADIHIRNVKRHTEYRLVFEKLFEEIKRRGTEDSIIYLAGDIVHAKLEMSPELIREVNWLLTQCSNLCPTILIAGNHDCNMNNADRLDVLSPIVEALQLPNLIYLKDTQVYKVGDTAFSVFSIFDKRDNWINGEDIDAKTKIALFHGPIDTSQTDVGYVVSSRHFTLDIFDGYDLALLGDIHRRQELISPKGCKVVYAGSLVQQNFGENVEGHGFLVWDLESRTYEEVDIKNEYGFYTIEVEGGVLPNNLSISSKAKVRIKFKDTTSADVKKVLTELKLNYGISEATVIHTDTLSKLKTGNRINKLDFEDVSDVNYQNSLIIDYIQRMYPYIDNEDIKGLEELNREVNNKLTQKDTVRNIQWKPIQFKFSNMFSYGEANVINFNNVDGLMGLFAPNASGKSSLFDAISFTLFDKCSRAFKASHIINNRKSTFNSHLHFQIEGIDYHIERIARTVNKGKSIKVDVEFWKKEGDNKISLNGTERRDTNGVIESYVGTYEDFVLTALSLQGNNALFIDKSQSERKDLLAKFMGLRVFDELYELGSDEVREVNTLIRNFKREDFTTELAQKKTDLKSKNKELKEVNNLLDEVSKEREVLENQLLELNKSIVKIDKNLDINQLNKSLLLSVEEKENLEGERKTKLQKIGEYNALLNEVSQSVVDNSRIGDIQIYSAKKKWDSYKTKINTIERDIELLKASISSNEERVSHLEKHEYDPNCKYCMNNVFVKDAISTKEKIKEQKRSLETLQEQHNLLLTESNYLSDVDNVYTNFIELEGRYNKGISVKQNSEIEVNTISSKILVLESKIEKIEKDIQTYYENEDIIFHNKKIEKTIEKVYIKKEEIERRIKETNSKVLDITGQIGFLESYIQSTQKKMDKMRDLETKNNLYTYYLDAVKRDGVPYELITKALPVIESEVNNILSQVVDFSVRLDTDGKNINAKIIYETQEWVLEMCSGMEKFISGLAIRVALINICSLPRPNFLVIDEGFGTLDSDNLSSLFTLMQYLKTQFEFIWVISHLEQMRDIVDGLVEIKKVNGFSQIKF